MDFFSCDVVLSSLFSIFIFFFSVGGEKGGRVDGIESEVNVGKRRRDGEGGKKKAGKDGSEMTKPSLITLHLTLPCLVARDDSRSGFCPVSCVDGMRRLEQGKVGQRRATEMMCISSLHFLCM